MNTEFSFAKFIVCHLTAEPTGIAHVLEYPGFVTIGERLFISGYNPGLHNKNGDNIRFYIAWDSISKFVMFENEDELYHYISD